MINWIKERYDEWKIQHKELGPSFAKLIPVVFTKDESELIELKDLPDTNRSLIILNNRNDRIGEFYGYFIKDKEGVKVFIKYSFSLRDWDLPLSPIYHVDLLKRALEWRNETSQNIHEITLEMEEKYAVFSYYLVPEVTGNMRLYDLLVVAKEIDNWGRNIVFELQNVVGSYHLEMSEKYSVYNLLDHKSLIERLENEIDPNTKGRLLEELISSLFEKIDGFHINERVRTQTEEIDILIINKSKDAIWNKESPLILVECKNWSSKCGKNEIVLFKEKLKNRFGRAKVGFFISWNGFTDTFNKELLRSSKDDIIIIPLTGKEIKEGMQSTKFDSILENWWLNSIKL